MFYANTACVRAYIKYEHYWRDDTRSKPAANEDYTRGV